MIYKLWPSWVFVFLFILIWIIFKLKIIYSNIYIYVLYIYPKRLNIAFNIQYVFYKLSGNRTLDLSADCIMLYYCHVYVLFSFEFVFIVFSFYLPWPSFP